MCLGSTESDLRPPNIGPSYARKKAASQEHWRSTVDTAMLKKSMPLKERENRKVTLPLAVFTKQLFHALRGDKTILVQAPEDLLSHPAIRQQHSHRTNAMLLSDEIARAYGMCHTVARVTTQKCNGHKLQLSQSLV